MKNEFLKKYEDLIEGVYSCYDRVVIRGYLHKACFADGMMRILNQHEELYKNYKTFVAPFRNEVIRNAEQLSIQQQVPLINIYRSVRKEDLVKEQLEKRGSHAGLVCILSVMESCNNYDYHFDKQTRRSSLKFTTAKCKHYYFYFVDEEYGLCYLRVPTWCPFQLQFYFNGHNWLANQLDKAGLNYELQDNAFIHIEDYEKAQAIADKLDVRKLHQRINHYAQSYCPGAFRLSPVGYQWSIMQVEYATDIVFKDDKSLAPIYDEILKTLMHTVTPDDVARFLGRKEMHWKNEQDLETSYKQVKRREMRRIKHRMGRSSIKAYDKFGRVFRLENTSNDVSQFAHYRSVVHRDGTKTSKVAPVKKSIYSLKGLIPIFKGCNNRYLKFISAIDTPISGRKRLQKIAKPTKIKDRSYRGFNFFDSDDERILIAIASGDFCIRGLSNKQLKKLIPHKTTEQISRILRRLTLHGLIKKVKNTYRYYLTTLGRKTINIALKIKELFIVHSLNYV